METDNNKMKNGEEVSGESTRMDGLFPADLSHVLRISRFGSEVSRRADLTFDERQQNLKKVLGNIRAFVPSEVSQRVHAVLYGKSDNAGGVIVFPADAEQPQLDELRHRFGQSTAMGGVIAFPADSDSHLLDEMERRFSQMLALFPQKFFTTKRLFRIMNSCPDYDPRKELIGAYAIGHYFKGHYSADSKEFSEQSLCIEVDGLSTQPLLYLGAFACRVFGQQLVLIKDNNTEQVYRADSASDRPDGNAWMDEFFPVDLSHLQCIRWFCSNGSRCPNVYNWRSKALAEDVDNNIKAFVGSEVSQRVLPGQYGQGCHAGGVIVFPADAVLPGRDEISNRLSQVLARFSEKFFSVSVLYHVLKSVESYDPEKELIGAYAIGHYFKGHYSADSKEFSEQSLCIEVDGLSTQPLLYLGEFVCRVFGQQLMLIKDNNASDPKSASIYRVDAVTDKDRRLLEAIAGFQKEIGGEENREERQ
jgi:hypothetical protein